MVKTRLSLGLFLALLVAALLIYAASLKLDDWAKAWMVGRLESQFSLRAEVGQMKVHLLGTRLEIHDLRLFNRAYPVTEPAFDSDYILLDFSFTSFFLPTISLDHLRLDSPRVRLLTDPNQRTNLSNMFGMDRMDRSDRDISLSPARLGIKRLVIDRGLLLLEQNPLSIQSSEGAMTAELRYVPESGEYHGQTSFTAVDLQVNDLAVNDMSVLVDFEWADRTFRILSCKLDSEVFELQAHGDLTLMDTATYSLEGTATLDTQELAEAGFPSHLRGGILSFNGNLSGRGKDFSLRGEARSDEIALSDLSFQQLNLALQMEPDSLSVENLQTRFEGGRLEAHGNLSWSPEGYSELQVAGSGIRFQRLWVLLGQKSIPALGTFDLSAQVRWPALQWTQMNGAGDLAYRGNFSTRNQSTPPNRPALAFEGHSRIGFKDGTAQFSRGVLRTPESYTDYSGHIILSGGYRFDLDLKSEQSNDLLRLARLWGLPERFVTQDFIEIQGSTQVSARLQSAKPQFEGSVHSRDIHVRQELLGDFQTEARFDGTVLEFTGTQVAGPGYRLYTTLRVTPSTGEMGWLDAVKLQLDDVPVERFLFLTEHKIPVLGRATGQLQIEQAGPQGFKGSGKITLSELEAYGEQIDRLSTEIRFEDQMLLLDQVRATVGRGGLSGQIEVNLEDRTGTVSLTGSQFSLDRIQRLQQTLPMQGEVDFDLHTQGRFLSPDFKLHLRGKEIVLADRIVENVQLQAESNQEVVRFRLTHTFLENPFRLEGQISREEPYALQARVDLKEVPLKPYVDLLSLENLSAAEGSLTGRLTVAGPLFDPRRLEVQAELSDLTLSLSGYELKNQSPLQLSYSSPTLQVSPFSLAGEGTELRIGGRFDLGESKSLNIEVSGMVNLVASNTFLSDGAAGGQLQVQTLIEGPLDNPRILGTAQVEKGLLTHPDLPTDLFDAAGQLRFTADQVALNNFSAQTAYGPVNLEGGIFLEGFQAVRWQIHVLAEGLRVEYPPQTISILDVNVDLVRSEFQDLISGSIQVASADYTENVSMVQLLSQYARSETEAPTPEAGRDFKLAMTVEGQQSLRARNNLIDAVGSINLNVRGTLQNPVILGTITIDEGQLFFENNEYEITRGTVLFNNPRRTQPTWNVEAQTLVRDFSIGVRIRGPFDRLRLSFSSDPPLPSSSIISLLTVGQTPEEILGTSGETQSQIGNLAAFGAGTVLSKHLTDRLESRTSRLLGLDQASVDPFLFGSEHDPGARITLGKQLGKGSVNYITDLGNTRQSQIVVFQYRITDWLTALGTREQDGSVAVDFKLEKRF